MKHLLLVLILLPLLSSCQSIENSTQKETFSFEWKLDKTETICYELIEKTVVDSLVFHFPNAETDHSPKKSNFEIFGYEPEKKYLVLKNRSEGLIDVFIVTIHKINEAPRYKMFTEGVDKKNLLRGIINKKGTSQSFYLAEGQENLITQYFQLPTKVLAVGDEWEIDLNITSYPANFKCTNFENRKSVVFEKIENNDIATFKYDIREFVKGKTFGVDVKSEIKYEGKAVFSVAKGRWMSYEAKYTLFSSGISEGNSINTVRLKLMDEVPVRVGLLLGE